MPRRLSCALPVEPPEDSDGSPCWPRNAAVAGHELGNVQGRDGSEFFWRLHSRNARDFKIWPPPGLIASSFLIFVSEACDHPSGASAEPRSSRAP